MKVTVIIPTFRRLKYMKQALDSVLQQTYQNFNCLIINDYPGDKEAIESMLSEINDDRLMLINHEFSKGGNAARNSGLKQAKGDIIAFLDDDDMWLPNKLLKHLQLHILNHDAGVIYSGLIVQQESKFLPDYVTCSTSPPQDVHTALMDNFCPNTTSCITVRRQCFEDCGFFDENLKSFQDWDMWFRISKYYAFDHIPEALTIFRHHQGDRTSRLLEHRLLGLQQITNKWKDEIVDISKFRRHYSKAAYYNHAVNLIIQNRKQEAIYYFYKFMKLSNAKDIKKIVRFTTRFLTGEKIYGYLLSDKKQISKFQKYT